MKTLRTPQITVISDVHLGTYGCHAKELLKYLKSIRPETLILNGDIIDIWNFRKSYFPSAHMDVIRRIMKMASKGTEVIYITGNHDDVIRKYTDLELGNLKVLNKYVRELDGKKAWFFHGDVFDSTTKGWAKYLAKLGGKGYDLLIILNRLINWILELLGKEKMSFSKKVKDSVKKAVSWINDFETTAAELAIEQGYDYVVCGHIHKPIIREIENNHGKVMYLNSGDWVENLSALEFNDGQWKMIFYHTMKDWQEDIHENDEKLNTNLLELVVSN